MRLRFTIRDLFWLVLAVEPPPSRSFATFIHNFNQCGFPFLEVSLE